MFRSSCDFFRRGGTRRPSTILDADSLCLAYRKEDISSTNLGAIKQPVL